MIKKTLAVNKIKAIIFDAGGVLYLRKGKFGYLNRGLAKLIKTLRRDFQIKTALLSDTRLSTLPVMLEKDKIENLFDIVTTSKETGLQKTDPEIYELVCKRLDVSPQETILVDDRKEFILAAKSLGMAEIIFVSNDKLKRNLKAYI